MINKDFCCNTYANFKETLTGRKLIVFGASQSCLAAAEPLLCGLDIDYYVDNNQLMWFKTIGDKEILPANQLKEEIPDDVVVLITVMRPFEIKDQLEEWGIVYYYSSAMFFDYFCDNIDNYLLITL